MVLKKSKLLILILIISHQFFNPAIYAGTVIYKPAWKTPEMEGDHGPFYTDTRLGLIIQGGNTVDNTIAFDTTNSFLTVKEAFIIGGHYNYGWDESGLSSRNWDARFRYQRSLEESLEPFVALIFEGDPFAGFTERTNYDLGVRFPFIGRLFTWNIEAGYRYTDESPTEEVERYQNKLRFQLGGERKVGDRGEVKVWVRYLPFLSDTQGDLSNYMFDYGVEISSPFAKNLYLNLSYIGNYRQVPLENRKQDDYKLIGSIGFKI